MPERMSKTSRSASEGKLARDRSRCHRIGGAAATDPTVTITLRWQRHPSQEILTALEKV
jgi:hypothetical protein